MVVSVSQSVRLLYPGLQLQDATTRASVSVSCAYNTRRTPLQHTVIWCLRLVSEKVSEAATFFLVFRVQFGGTGRSRSKGIRASGTLE